jgi:hypothetical protein
MELGGMGGTAPDGIGAIEPEGIGAIELGCIVLAAGIGFIEVEGLTGNSLEGLNPLQRPPLQMLYAHCASLSHSALKFPHWAINMALLAQHWTPFAHWLGLTNGLHSAPRGREPAGATTVGDGAGIGPWLVGVLAPLVTIAEDEEEVVCAEAKVAAAAMVKMV